MSFWDLFCSGECKICCSIVGERDICGANQKQTRLIRDSRRHSRDTHELLLSGMVNSSVDNVERVPRSGDWELEWEWEWECQCECEREWEWELE